MSENLINEGNYLNCLYRKDNKGNICVWHAVKYGYDTIKIYHGILNKTINVAVYHTSRDPYDEINSRTNQKRKRGYKYLNEIRDNHELPRREELLNWLTTYLPEERTDAEGKLLPMLAKTYDNENNKLFKKVNHYIGQWKINGLRCFITAYEEAGLFNTKHLQFQSREGIIWNSLGYLEQNLLAVLPNDFIDKMIHEGWALDGELYIPGYSVNEINHAVKDPRCHENRLVQFWCYDVACEDYDQYERLRILENYLHHFCTNFGSLPAHLAHKCIIEVLPYHIIENGEEATKYRDFFIDKGFEGLILRNPFDEYQFGKRNSSMIKYKKSTDGIFEIVDIYPEGNKRSDIPLFKCKNDINDETFECHLSAPLEVQRKYLFNRELYIGRKLQIEFGERSGVNQVPFHVKNVSFYNDNNKI